LREEVSKIKIDDKYAEIKIRNIVEFVTSLTTKEILLYVYTDDVTKNEGMTKNSSVKNNIFSQRIPIATSMVRRGKVSIEKGAELAGMDLQDFMKILERRAPA
ncbi:MAG: UPF0175 family protein, partial [Candidatus Methanomethylophilaceae archaeon]|nr:UPF0175 family protein [Candidatus Methanomethylophilaceae archaeon]